MAYNKDSGGSFDIKIIGEGQCTRTNSNYQAGNNYILIGDSMPAVNIQYNTIAIINYYTIRGTINLKNLVSGDFVSVGITSSDRAFGQFIDVNTGGECRLTSGGLNNIHGVFIGGAWHSLLKPDNNMIVNIPNRHMVYMDYEIICTFTYCGVQIQL